MCEKNKYDNNFFQNVSSDRVTLVVRALFKYEPIETCTHCDRRIEIICVFIHDPECTLPSPFFFGRKCSWRSHNRSHSHPTGLFGLFLYFLRTHALCMYFCLLLTRPVVVLWMHNRRMRQWPRKKIFLEITIMQRATFRIYT